MRPDAPVYVVSKGRWQSRLTAKALDRMRVPYFVVVEEPEYGAYRAVRGPLATVLILDPAYQREYSTCDEVGDAKGKGPGPARNFAWDHAKENGRRWHWVMDDNIAGFVRLVRNQKIQAHDGAIFRAMEDFCERYSNVAMAGPNYREFAKGRQPVPPFIIGTRIYSCNLIRTDAPFRWRGRYNEDTILSLDMLKAGWVTVQFNAFLQNKLATQTLAGGNTAEFYEREGTLPKSQMLVREHPDVCRLAWRFGRPHHYCDYRPFKANRLRRKPGVVIPTEPNEYGMRLVRLDDPAHIQGGTP
jgi:hypothetical protein